MPLHLQNPLTMWGNFVAVVFGDVLLALLLAFDFCNHYHLVVPANVMMEVVQSPRGVNIHHMLLMNIMNGAHPPAGHHDPLMPIMNQEMKVNAEHLLENDLLLPLRGMNLYNEILENPYFLHLLIPSSQVVSLMSIQNEDERGVLPLHLQHLELPRVRGGMERGKRRPLQGHSPDSPDKRRV